VRVLVNIGHPAHVHFYRNFISEMKKRGHETKVTVEPKEVAVNLLRAYGIEFEDMGQKYREIIMKGLGIMIKDYKLLKIVRKFRPDVIMGILDTYGSHVGKLIGVPSIVFTDTEHAKMANKLTFPFATVICTPSCFKKDLGKKQVRYTGYHELAYLHPNYFKQDSVVLDDFGLGKDDKFIILRFVSWEASHDIKQKGLDLQTKKELIKEIEKHAQVFITSEKALTKDFEKYRMTNSPEKMHDLLYYATMYIGEGATMASEAAILGTPAIYINTQRLGYLDEQEEIYGLVYNFSNPKTAQEQIIRKAIELLEDEDLKKKWQKKREKLLSEKIDVTKFMTEFIENYPKSFKEWKANNSRN
jgi:predicted glycosyltransferase